MDELFEAYRAGRADGSAGHRDAVRADDPDTGADYRIGLLDGRIETFHMLTLIRKLLDEGPA